MTLLIMSTSTEYESLRDVLSVIFDKFLIKIISPSMSFEVTSPVIIITAGIISVKRMLSDIYPIDNCTNEDKQRDFSSYG